MKTRNKLWLITVALFGTGLTTGIVMKYKGQVWYLLFGLAMALIVKMFLDVVIKDIEGEGNVTIKIKR